eukprot:7380818-Prymnesium_polylepis.2
MSAGGAARTLPTGEHVSPTLETFGSQLSSHARIRAPLELRSARVELIIRAPLEDKLRADGRKRLLELRP